MLPFGFLSNNYNAFCNLYRLGHILTALLAIFLMGIILFQSKVDFVRNFQKIYED